MGFVIAGVIFGAIIGAVLAIVIEPLPLWMGFILFGAGGGFLGMFGGRRH